MKIPRTLRLGMRGYDVDGAKRVTYKVLDDGGKWHGYQAQSAVSRRYFGPFFRRDVKLAQRKLAKRKTKAYKGKIDGVFGQATFDAAKAAGEVDWVAERLFEQHRPARCCPLPAGVHFSIIGYPNQGTHRARDWQSRNALDWRCAPGTAIIAPITGRAYRVGGSEGIRYVGNKIIFGRKLTIIPPAGPRCFITHLSHLRVSEGQLIKAGDILGVVGNYGPGSHAHISLEYGDPQAMQKWPRLDLPI